MPQTIIVRERESKWEAGAETKREDSRTQTESPMVINRRKEGRQSSAYKKNNVVINPEEKEPF